MRWSVAGEKYDPSVGTGRVRNALFEFHRHTALKIQQQ